MPMHRTEAAQGWIDEMRARRALTLEELVAVVQEAERVAARSRGNRLARTHLVAALGRVRQAKRPSSLKGTGGGRTDEA